jgi:hypothetical protein
MHSQGHTPSGAPSLQADANRVRTDAFEITSRNQLKAHLIITGGPNELVREIHTRTPFPKGRGEADLDH